MTFTVNGETGLTGRVGGGGNGANLILMIIMKGKEVMWQPIETAPKDGTDILVMASYSMAPAVVYWKNGNVWDCWCLSAVMLRVGDEVKLTHWMPLPEPPK